MVKSFRLMAAILLILPLLLTAQESEPVRPPARRDLIEMRALDAEILPAWEIILPTGHIEIRTEDFFGGVKLGFQSYFNFIDNTLGASVAFSYPVGILEPSIRFYQDVDFENTVDVGLTGSIVELNETASYISRQRGISGGLALRPLDWLSFGPLFSVTEVYEGDIASSKVLDDSIYLLPAFRIGIDTLSISDLEEKIYTGFEMEMRSDWRFRENFEQPVEWDLLSKFAVKSGWNNDLYMNSRAEFGLPLRVWEEGASSFYSLGGYRSVHGYTPSSISAFRYGMLNGELKLPAFLRQSEDGLHRIRMLLIGDLLATQRRQALSTGLDWYAGAGTGVSFIISGRGNRHFRTRAYIALPISDEPLPVFYLETSLFSLSRGL